MADGRDDIDRLEKKLAYYQQLSEELAATTLQQDYTVSTLRHRLKQKRQSFSILAELQQSIDLRTPISTILEMTVRSVNSTLAMDKTIVFGPTEKEDCFKPLHWHGFDASTSEQVGEMELWLPWERHAEEGSLLVNAATKATPAIASIQSAFELSYFACVPIQTEQELIGLLVTGRLIESRPYHARLNEEDVDTLKAIVSLIAKAVQNREMAALKAENERKELELQKAAELEEAYRALEDTNRQLKAAQAKLESQAQKLYELDEQKSRFFAHISHEFRTPLTLIIGPLEDALGGEYGELPEPLQRAHRSMLNSARRLLRLVGQLLDLSKLEHEGMELIRQEDDLCVFVRDIVHRFSSLAERQKVALRFNAGAELLPAPFDADKLDKVVSNLLSNALKFTPEHGKVMVRVREHTSEDERWTEIAVKDTGPGISSADMERIFDQFQQGNVARSTAQEGTGLGLALAKQLVELHGGEILVDSIEDFGSTFTVRLPMDAPVDAPSDDRDADPSEELMSLGEAVPGDGQPVMAAHRDGPAAEERDAVLLLVEDNAEVRAFLRRHLEKDYRIVEAIDGAEGLALAQEHAPDLVISDVMMPEMDGFELVKALKADERLQAIPIILLTARADAEDAAEGLQKGADDYLTKPFSMKELRARVEGLVRTRRQLRERYSREVVVAPSDVVISSDEVPFVEKVLETVEEHLSDSTFGTSRLADALGLSRRHLTRRVKEATGESPGKLLRRMRLDRAAQLLRETSKDISEIARAVGFNSPSHFSKSFQRQFGTSPSRFRESGT